MHTILRAGQCCDHLQTLWLMRLSIPCQIQYSPCATHTQEADAPDKLQTLSLVPNVPQYTDHFTRVFIMYRLHYMRSAAQA